MTAPQIAAGKAVPSRLVRALDVLAFEWTKLRSVRSNYITLIIAATATIGSTAIVAHTVGSAPASPQGGTLTALTVSFLGYAEYGVIPVSVLAVLQFTSEYTTGLISTTFCAVPRRWAVLAGKAAVAGGAALVAGEVLGFACFFLSQAMLSGRHRGVSLAQPGVPGAVLAGGFLLCACALTALGLGAIIRRTPGAIAATLAVIYGLAAFCLALPSPWKDGIGKFTMPFAAWQVLATHPQPGLLSPALSMLVLIGWPAAALLAAALVITRRDA
jgi:ABC-type transport system involved in multi-copper enzyme maturation permease subunit